ncbi:MAG: VWA domain-containing protein [bacterium]
MRFENAALLPWGLAAALILLAVLIFRDLKFIKINYSNFSSLLKATSKQQYLYLIPDIIKLVAIIFLVIALLRPQLVKKEMQEKIKGIDIILALDISGSMQAEDLQPNRLEAAKRVCREFVSGLVNDRAGLVVFAGKAFTQCPLTVDYEIVKNFIDQVDLQTIRIDGTAIGEALLTATNRLESSGASKVIILATDGGNNRGMSPIDAAKIAAFKKIKIYTIGIGKKGGSPMLYTDNFGTKRRAVNNFTGQPLSWEEPDEASLKQVAAIGGGRYFRATDEHSLKEIYDIIGKLEKQDIQVKTYDKREDKFIWFLWAGFILLFAALGLEAWKFLRIVA